MARRRTTLAEVAAAAGVSVATVSKVVNQRADVSDRTRRLVLRHLHERAYRPTGSDGARRRSTRTIEVVFPNVQNAYSIAVLEGITEAAGAAGLDVVIGRTLGGSRHIDPEVLLKSGRAGAVFITMDLAADDVVALREADFPVVVVDPLRQGGSMAQGRDNSECVSVGATNYAGGVAATEHLLGLGHRRVAHAGGPALVDCSHARLAGYTSALRRAGIRFDESLITHCDFDYEAGRESAGHLLDRPDPPTAIFAGNDEIALGVMEEARRRSILVPADLSIVGFDDTFLATRSAPQLTTVAQPLIEMGSTAVHSLTALLEHEPVGSSHLELATKLVVRDSTLPLRT